MIVLILLLKIIFSSTKNYFKLSDINKTYLDIYNGQKFELKLSHSKP